MSKPVKPIREDDVRRRYGIKVECCDSCHEDLDQGWEASTIEVDGQEVSVCCTVANAYKAMMLPESKQ